MKIYRLEIGIDTEHEDIIYIDESITEDQYDVLLNKETGDTDTSYDMDMAMLLSMSVGKVYS